MRLWYFPSSVNAFFIRSCAAVQWGSMSEFGRTLRLLPYFMRANSESSDEIVQMRRLACAVVGRLYNKYHHLMSWLTLRYWRNQKLLMEYVILTLIDAFGVCLFWGGGVQKKLILLIALILLSFWLQCVHLWIQNIIIEFPRWDRHNVVLSKCYISFALYSVL